MHLAVDKSHYDIMEILLKHGAKVNALDSLGQTSLHRAAREGNIQACRILLSFGVDHRTVSLQGKVSDSFSLESASNDNLNSGLTAAQVANDAVAKLLEEEPAIGPAGADIEYQLLEAAKVESDQNLVKNYTKSCHSLCLKAGDLELVKRIVAEHSNIVNCRDLDGRHSTPLHFAAGYNRVGVVEFLLSKVKKP